MWQKGEIMLDLAQYLSLPTTAVLILAGLYLAMNIIGEILEAKGKIVPELMKIRKYFARKRTERETLAKMAPFMDEVQSHYSPSSLEKRDKWMESVDKQLADTNEWRSSISGQLAENRAITLAILIENKRSEILNFASYVIKDENPVTHEQFRRTFKVYDEYEAILNKNNMTNGEINTAIRIIRESYETHLRNQTFVEDTRWKH